MSFRMFAFFCVPLMWYIYVVYVVFFSAGAVVVFVMSFCCDDVDMIRMFLYDIIDFLVS